MEYLKRRNFLKLSGLSVLPAIVGGTALAANAEVRTTVAEAVNFTDDGVFYDPAAYINKLQEINRSTTGGIGQDFYGQFCDTLASKHKIIVGARKVDGVMKLG